jgi:hypothetical protein
MQRRSVIAVRIILRQIKQEQNVILADTRVQEEVKDKVEIVVGHVSST